MERKRREADEERQKAKEKWNEAQIALRTASHFQWSEEKADASGTINMYVLIDIVTTYSPSATRKMEHSRDLRRYRNEILDKIADFQRKIDRYTNQMSKFTEHCFYKCIKLSTYRGM